MTHQIYSSNLAWQSFFQACKRVSRCDWMGVKSLLWRIPPQCLVDRPHPEHSFLFHPCSHAVQQNSSTSSEGLFTKHQPLGSVPCWMTWLSFHKLKGGRDRNANWCSNKDPFIHLVFITSVLIEIKRPTDIHHCPFPPIPPAFPTNWRKCPIQSSCS